MTFKLSHLTAFVYFKLILRHAASRPFPGGGRLDRGPRAGMAPARLCNTARGRLEPEECGQSESRFGLCVSELIKGIDWCGGCWSRLVAWPPVCRQLTWTM